MIYTETKYDWHPAPYVKGHHSVADATSFIARVKSYNLGVLSCKIIPKP